MKIRNGFVSNSSSSSFVIFGKILSSDEFAKRFGFTEDEMEDIHENGVYDYENRLTDCDYQYLSDDDEWIVGRSVGGSKSDIIEDMNIAESALGSGCKLYSGIDTDGEVTELNGV